MKLLSSAIRARSTHFTHFIPIYILSSHLQESVQCMFVDRTFWSTYRLFHACCMPYTSHPPWYEREAHTMTPLNTQFPSASRHSTQQTNKCKPSDLVQSLPSAFEHYFVRWQISCCPDIRRFIKKKKKVVIRPYLTVPLPVIIIIVNSSSSSFVLYSSLPLLFKLCRMDKLSFPCFFQQSVKILPTHFVHG